MPRYSPTDQAFADALFRDNGFLFDVYFDRGTLDGFARATSRGILKLAPAPALATYCCGYVLGFLARKCPYGADEFALRDAWIGYHDQLCKEPRYDRKE